MFTIDRQRAWQNPPHEQRRCLSRPSTKSALRTMSIFKRGIGQYGVLPLRRSSRRGRQPEAMLEDVEFDNSSYITISYGKTLIR